MSAKTFEEWVRKESAECCGIGNTSVGQIIWNAAVKATEEKFISTNSVMDSIVSKKEKTCAWKYEKYDYYWNTSCGESFVFNEGTPEDNKVIYCFHCGKKISVKTKKGKKE